MLPIWNLGGDQGTWKKEGRLNDLATIVDGAAHMSIIMRCQADTVYYWQPTFKDEEFEPKRMECFNLQDMLRDSPYDTKTINGFERAVLRPGREDESEAIVRVVCFPGLVAYRQGGGKLAQKELADEKAITDRAPPDVRHHRKVQSSRQGQKELDGSEGFRTKVICKSVVMLQWSKQRLLTKEAGTSAHLDAVRNHKIKNYAGDRPDFVELYDHFSEVTPKPLGDQQPSPGRSWSSIFGTARPPPGNATNEGSSSRQKPGSRGGGRRTSRSSRS